MDERVKSAAANPSPLAGEGREGGRGAGAQAWGLGRAVDAEINSARLSSTPSPPTPDPSPQGGGEQALRHVRQRPPARFRHKARAGRGRSTSTISASPRARFTLPSDSRRRPAGALPHLSLERSAPALASLPSSPHPTSRARTTSRRLSATTRSSSTTKSAFRGQALFAVVAIDPRCRAPRREACRRSRSRPRPPSVTIEDALARGETVLPDYAFGRGDAAAAIAAAPHRLEGSFRVGGQEHFYLEGQVALADPGRGRRRSTSIPRRSIRPRSSTSSPACSAFRMPMSPARPAAWAAASAARRARRRNGRRSRRLRRA